MFLPIIKKKLLMKKVFLFLFFAFWVNSLAGQNDLKNFGKVDGEDFRETVYDESGYDAVVLFKQKKAYFDVYNGSLRFYNENHVRMKILNDGIFTGKTYEIPFSGKNEYDKVLAVKVCVYSQNGKKVVSKKLKFKDIEYRNSDSLHSSVLIHLPEVKKGDILEMRYYFISFDFLLPPKIEFASEYPCLNSYFIASFPENMKYKYDVYEGENFVYHSQNQTFQTISYTFSPYDNPKSFYYMYSGRRFNLNFRFSNVVDTFKVSNLLPKENYDADFQRPSIIMKAYKFTQDIGYSHPIYQAGWQQMTHLLYVYAEPDNRYLSQSEAWFKMYNAGYVIVKADSWDYLHKRLKKSPDFYKPLAKFFPVEPSLQKILEEAEFSDTLTVIKQLYDYVNKQVAWDGTFKNYVDKKPETVLKTQKGSSAEINLTLISLLRRAGLEAFPALSATKDFGRVDTAYASRIQFNNVLAVVKLSDEKCLVMDCSDKNSPYNQLPDRDLNGCCWAVAPDEGFFIWF